MKKLIAILSILAGAQALAFSPSQVSPSAVASECAKQMAMGVCMATPDRSSVTPGQTMLIAGMGRVQYSAYLDYMDKYNPANPSDPAMCGLALEKMTAEPGSDHDKIARALWQPPPEPEPKTSIEWISAAIGLGAATFAGAVAFVMLRRRNKCY